MTGVQTCALPICFPVTIISPGEGTGSGYGTHGGMSPDELTQRETNIEKALAYSGASWDPKRNSYVRIDGTPYTIQVKPFSTTSLNEENFHIVEGSAAVKKYTTDLMGFISKNRDILVFHTPGMDISKGDYRFPKENKMEL